MSLPIALLLLWSFPDFPDSQLRKSETRLPEFGAVLRKIRNRIPIAIGTEIRNQKLSLPIIVAHLDENIIQLAERVY